jgi:dienelactone hydrolase
MSLIWFAMNTSVLAPFLSVCRTRILLRVLLLFALQTSADAIAQSAPTSPEFIVVNEGGLAAHLYLPPGRGPFPILLAVGGSEGGFITGDAYGKMFPNEGIAVLGLAYFGAPGLPEAIDRIPLEYFVRAIDFVAHQPSLDRDHIALVGGSKGGELALLVAANDPRIKAVCAIVPSSVVWQSARLLNRSSSSWTHRGYQIPFVPYKGPIMPQSGRIADLFDLSLTNDAAVASSTIPVENIRGPILFISASRDEIWPSKKMSDAMIKRLDEKKFPYAHRHLTYDTGHGFSKELAPEVNGVIVEFFKAELLQQGSAIQ